MDAYRGKGLALYALKSYEQPHSSTKHLSHLKPSVSFPLIL